jgi:hypothetical protein
LIPTPTPILTVLSTFQKNGVQTLLMGGQACVFYGVFQIFLADLRRLMPGANSAASLGTFAKSAPEKPGVCWATFASSASAARGLLRT